jgi:hypothetical protein
MELVSGGEKRLPDVVINAINTISLHFATNFGPSHTRTEWNKSFMRGLRLTERLP